MGPMVVDTSSRPNSIL